METVSMVLRATQANIPQSGPRARLVWGCYYRETNLLNAQVEFQDALCLDIVFMRFEMFFSVYLLSMNQRNTPNKQSLPLHLLPSKLVPCLTSTNEWNLLFTNNVRLQHSGRHHKMNENRQEAASAHSFSRHCWYHQNRSKKRFMMEHGIATDIKIFYHTKPVLFMV